MAEPSIAGLRAEGEKLSPDGSKVIYLWNAEGKMLRGIGDHIDAIDFMVRNYSVDQSRSAFYGGSYGGFMAAMLAMRAP